MAWTGVSGRKNFLRRDLVEVLGDKDTDTRLGACERGVSREPLSSRGPSTLRTGVRQELGYRRV